MLDTKLKKYHKLAVLLIVLSVLLPATILVALYPRMEQVYLQQKKELESEKRGEHAIRIMRHDMRLLLGNLSVCLENGDKAQLSLPVAQRRILLLLKQQNGRILLSVKNPFLKKPQFADGLPLSERKGHGYGTQSIRYLTERMGGNCQFTTEHDQFVLQVVI